jgi:hypothetical protein
MTCNGQLINNICVENPKISPWGDEPCVIRIFKEGESKGVEITIKVNVAKKQLEIKASPSQMSSSK